MKNERRTTLFYVIPHYVNYKDKDDDCAIAIVYYRDDSEMDMSYIELAKNKLNFVAEGLGLDVNGNKVISLRPNLIPITEKQYFEEYK